MSWFPEGISVHLLPVFVLLSVVTLVPACSSTYELRQPEKELEVRDGDSIMLYLPVNDTLKSGSSFRDITGVSTEKRQVNFEVSSFPRAGQRLQETLSAILEQNEQQLTLMETTSTGIPIPYRLPREGPEQTISVLQSDRHGPMNPHELVSVTDQQVELVIAGQVRSGFVGAGTHARERTERKVPPGHALFRVDTVWQMVMPGTGTSKFVEIRDEAVVNLSRYPAEPVRRSYHVKQAFDQLLRRVAWRVASRLIRHQYDTSFGKDKE